MYEKCISDKKLCNNLQFQFDSSHKGVFQTYETTQQKHDAGYDAYMTGTIFATLSKYYEIGHLIANATPSAKNTPKTPGTPKTPKELRIKNVHYSTLQNR